MMSRDHRGSSGAAAEAGPPVPSLVELGYALFPAVFTDTEIRDLRAAVAAYFRRSGRFEYGGKTGARGYHALPAVAQTLLSDRLLAIAAACTWPERPVLTGECDVHANVLSRWHKDIHDDWALTDAIFADRAWRVYKAAVYLQDQPAASPTALKVRPGSHRRHLGEVEETRALAVKAGDVIVFDVRLDHAGQFPSVPERALRRGLKAAMAPLRRDHEAWFAHARTLARALRPGGAERMALYPTFGPDRACTYAYEREGRASHGPLPGALDAGTRARLARHRVGLIE
jgi:hypothetical protein